MGESGTKGSSTSSSFSGDIKDADAEGPAEVVGFETALSWYEISSPGTSAILDGILRPEEAAALLSSLLWKWSNSK